MFIAADDLVSLTTLSLDVPGTAAVQILGSRRNEISDLLRQIPTALELVDAETLTLDRGEHWEPLAAALCADDQKLHKHLITLRDDAGIGTDISSLRVLDVLAWMSGKGYAATE